MVDEVIKKQELIDAQKDAQSLEDIVNGEPGKLITTRLGREVYTLSSIPVINTMTRYEINAALSNLSTTANKYYATLAAATTDIANIAINQSVTIGESGTNGGLWYKATAGATSLTKSAYDPLTQAKAFATDKANTARKEALAALVTTSSNLFNDSTSIKENKLISGTGEIVVATGITDFAYSDFIAIEPNQNYFYDGFRHIAYYDNERNFIERVDSVRTGNGTFPDPYKFTGALLSPTNAYFIRVNYRTQERTDYTDINRKINLGSLPIPYEPFYEKLKEGIEVEKSDAWVFGSKHIENGAINTDKVDFVKKSTNLFNYATSTVGYAISSTGEIVVSANYSISDFIPVAVGKYTISGDAGYEPFINTAYYDENKNFISRDATNVGSNAFRVLTIPTGVAYVRFNMNAGTASQRNRMFNIGDVALPYENYYEPKLDILLSEKAINQIAAEIDTESQMDQYLKTSSNLFDISTAIVENKIISGTGEVVEATGTPDWAMSDYIAVDANSSYYFDGFRYIAFFTSTKTFISRVSPPNTNVGGKYYGAITTPSDAAFAIVMWRTSLKEYLNGEGHMINAGSSPAQYEKFGIQLSGLRLGKDISDQLKEEFNQNVSDQIVFDMPIDGIYTTDAVWTEHSDFRTVTAGQVYQIYDDLLAQHPDIISKTFLGNDSFEKPVSIYRFKPYRPNATLPIKTAKVFLLCGQHGQEHSPPLATYLMLREIYNNWQSNPLLEALRFNVEFLVIPVLNCGGWDAYSALNANGVNLNRNYPTDKWINRPDGTSGTAPASEVETQIVLGVFDEHKDINIFIDFHNFNGLVGETRMVWVSSTGIDTRMQSMGQALISKMTRHWRSKYEWIPEPPYFAGNVDGGDTATVKYYAQSKLGIILSSTLEVSGHNWLDPNGVQHDVTHKRTSTETVLNWLLINLNQLQKM